jgi:hypothetical protein
MNPPAVRAPSNEPISGSTDYCESLVRVTFADLAARFCRISLGKSLCVPIFKEAVEMGPVENSAQLFAITFHSLPNFIGCRQNSSAKLRLRSGCGKLVKTVWTERVNFEHFSLAPDASFRQNPARAVDPVAVEDIDFTRRCAVGVRSARFGSDCPDHNLPLAWREVISTAFPHQWKLR